MKKVAFLFILFFTSSFPQTYPVVQDFLISGNDNIPSTYKQNYPSLYVASKSNFVVSWSDYRDGDPLTYAQLFDSSGNKTGSNFNINSDFRAYSNEDQYIFTLNETNSNLYYFNYFTIYGNLYFNSKNIEKSIPVFSGEYPECGMGFIGGEDLILSCSNGFYYLTNYGGNLALVKIRTDGTAKYFNFPDYNAITQITSAATSEGDYFFSWINGSISYDSLKTGLYATFINRQDSIIKNIFITELVDTVGIWNYIGNYNLKSIALNDSTYKLFWLNNASLMLYSVKLNSGGQIISEIDSIQIPKPYSNYSNPGNVIITNKQDDGFYIRLSWINYTGDPAFNYFIKYNLNGEQTGSIVEKESSEYYNNLFYAGSDQFFSTSSDDKDVFLNRLDFTGVIEKKKINDDQSGSNEINQKLINYDDNSVIAIWNDEEKSHGIIVNKDGNIIGSKFELKSSNAYLFPDKESVSPWVKKNPDTTYSAGYTIYDKDFKEKFSKILITKSSDYSLSLQIHIISDSVFVALLNSFDEIKLIKEEKTGKTEFAKVTASGSLLRGASIYFDDFKSPPDNYFWLYNDGHLTKFSYDFIRLTDEKIFNHTINRYLGEDKFLIVNIMIGSYNNNVTASGTIVNSDNDTIKTGIHLCSFKNNEYKLYTSRITPDAFLIAGKYGKDFYARAFTNAGIAKKDSFLVNWKSFSPTSNLNFIANDEKVFFTWSDAETRGKGYDIYGCIFNLSSIITGIRKITPVIPEAFNLFQNYPNPFNPSTIIKYSLAEQCFVKITVYDILGRKIKDLFEGNQKAGFYELNFNSSDLPLLSSGIYLYSISANYRNGSFRGTKKMILLK